jgi:hypothetical protein
MRAYIAAVLGLCFLGLVGCGLTTSASSGATTQPASSLPVNTSPGTTTSGPVVIATDHSVYAPTDVMHITITNHLTSTIYAYDHQASCSIVRLEVQQGSAWQAVPSTIAGCPIERPTIAVAITPGTEYQADVRAGYERQGDQSFSQGTYRVAFAYSDGPLQDAVVAPNMIIYSSSLTVNNQYQPQPIPTAPSGGVGTATVGTVEPVGTTHP